MQQNGLEVRDQATKAALRVKSWMNQDISSSDSSCLFRRRPSFSAAVFCVSGTKPPFSALRHKTSTFLNASDDDAALFFFYVSPTKKKSVFRARRRKRKKDSLAASFIFPRRALNSPCPRVGVCVCLFASLSLLECSLFLTF